MNREELKKIMPHREPMLLLDEAFPIDDTHGTGSYTVRGDEFFLQGHYPGNPVVPGVILCEMMAQCACSVLGQKLTGGIPYFTGLDKVRIRNKVVPNDTFCIKVALIDQKAAFYFIECEGRVNDKLCISGRFSFAVVSDHHV